MSHLPTPDYSVSPESHHSTTASLSPVLSSSQPLPSTSTSKSPKDPSSSFRKGRWTPSELTELRAVGEAVLVPGKREDFEAVKAQLKGEARHRSVPAIRAKYLAMLKEKAKKEREEKAKESAEVKVEEGSSAATEDAQPVSLGSQADGSWSIEEDAALYTTLAMLPLRPLNLRTIFGMVARNYFKTEGKLWTKSNEEFEARWKTILEDLMTTYNHNAILTASLNIVGSRLAAVFLEACASIPALASSQPVGGAISGGAAAAPAAATVNVAAPAAGLPPVSPPQSIAASFEARQQRRQSIVQPGPVLATWQPASQQQQQAVPTSFHAGPPAPASGLLRTTSSPLPGTALFPPPSASTTVRIPASALPAPTVPPLPHPPSLIPIPLLAAPRRPSDPLSQTIAPPPTGTPPFQSTHPHPHAHAHAHAHVHFADEEPHFAANGNLPAAGAYSPPSLETTAQVNRYRARLGERGFDDVGGREAFGSRGSPNSGSGSGSSGPSSRRTSYQPYGMEGDPYSSTGARGYSSAAASSLFPSTEKADENDLKVVDFAEVDAAARTRLSPLFGGGAGGAGQQQQQQQQPYLGGTFPSSSFASVAIPYPGADIPVAGPPPPSAPSTTAKSVSFRRPKAPPTIKIVGSAAAPPAGPASPATTAARRHSTRKRSREVSYAESEVSTSSSSSSSAWSSRAGSIGVGGGGDGEEGKVEAGGKRQKREKEKREKRGKEKKPSARKAAKEKALKRDVGAEEWHDEDAEGEDDDEEMVVVEEPKVKRGRRD
ncbi:hypothetical protein JCM6882_009077 [Rhodosporidiobolus microsporus]